MYHINKGGVLKHWDFLLLDNLVLQICYCVAYMYRHGWGEFPYDKDIYGNLSLIIVVLDLLVVFFSESYKNILRRGALAELKQTFSHMSFVTLLVFCYMFIMKISEEYSRTVFITMWILAIVVGYGARMLLKCFIRKCITEKTRQRSVLLVTTSAEAEGVIEHVRERKYRDFRINAIILVDRDGTGEYVSDIPIVASREQALKYIGKNVIDEVFFHIDMQIPYPQELLEGCIRMGTTIHLNMTRMTGISGNKIIENFGDYTVMTSSLKIATTRQLVLKRLMDIAGAVVGLLLTGVAYLFVAPAIKIKSPGPVFFAQTRIGKNGRHFKLYKFRSMYMDAEERKKELMEQNEMDGLMFKMTDDPRIIKGVGHFIRKFSVDELPQFWNVLKGDMSLVGTRPPTVDEYEQYDLHHYARMAIKPGITGMWQVSGRSDITDFEEVVRLDMKYIENWKLGLDIKIILMTVGAVFGKKGSK